MWSGALTLERIVRKKCAISSGVEYPTVSGRLMVVAPAWITASITPHRNSTSLRCASSAENSTSSTCACESDALGRRIDALVARDVQLLLAVQVRGGEHDVHPRLRRR